MQTDFRGLTSTSSYAMLEPMKIVICDDSIEDLIKIEKLLKKYEDFCADTNIEAEKFSDPSKLYEEICQKELADIYILDMLMPEKTGIDIGSRLEKNDGGSVIIYITSSDDFALEAYRVHAARYLLKPVREEEFFEAMDYALSHREVKKCPAYLVKTKDGFVSVPYSQIEYIENASRTLEIHMADGKTVKSIFIRKSFDAEIEELLKDRRFLQVHKSYLINLKYVKILTQSEFVMESGKSIPVSKTRIAGVKKDYLLFVSEQYR